jgi:hypothetical protein
MRDVLIQRWSEMGEKIVTLAGEFPAGQYDERPTEAMRSFGEQLRHVAFWNDYAAESLAGGKPDGAANELPKAQFANRRQIVEALRGSFDRVATALAQGEPDPATAVSFLEHNGEHYGQLVVYYRLRGLVPPASRG